MIRYAWRVYGAPVGQPRTRAYRRGSKAAVYDPGTASAWKDSVKSVLASEGYPREPLTGPVELTLVFRLSRPVSHYARSGGLRPGAPLEHTQKPDTDNLVKAVFDAMSDLGVWGDDAQVTGFGVRKRWAEAADAGVEITLSAPY